MLESKAGKRLLVTFSFAGVLIVVYVDDSSSFYTSQGEPDGSEKGSSKVYVKTR